MSTADNKKTKRRKIKNAVTKSSASCNVSSNSNQTNGVGLPQTHNKPSIHQMLEDEEKLEELIKSSADLDLNALPSNFFSRGPNPFMKENCLLCGCERIDPPEADKIKTESDNCTKTDNDSVTKLPLWVCAICRKAADSELLDKKDTDIPFLDQDLQPETIPFPFLPDINLDTSENYTPNGTLCTCESCKERRQISDEYNKETQELQKSWVELRKMVQDVYQSKDPYLSEPDKICFTDLVVKLCSRDPHQLFLRLESIVRDMVIEKKVLLIQQSNKGLSTVQESQEFINRLLEEYSQLTQAAKVTSERLADLKEHLKRFKVTWDLHNKHLFQSIVYSHPAIHHNLPVIIDTIRLGVGEIPVGQDPYPNIIRRFSKFQDEMSVILVVWRDCQQNIENYNEEQTALKVKQKWLKEDWEFFKAQRKLLEQQVLKNPKACQSTHNMEAQFTETMRNLLQGTRPSVEELYCPRCNRKRCPCDECTITHMITCGIINPEALEHSSTSHTFNFSPDTNFPSESNYFLDVHPPSVSSSNCSSGSVSPIMVDPERLIQPFGNCPEDFENGDDIPEEIIDDSQSDDSDDELDEDDDDIDDDDDEDDEDDDDDDDMNDCCSNEKSKSDEGRSNSASSAHSSLHNWVTESTSGGGDCDCYHCVGTKAEQMFQDPYPCQCHLCLQPPSGPLLNSGIPQHMPMSPRPTDLHIYPHIHGYPGLHGFQGRNVRSVLQPQLYDLHNPLRQAKLPTKMDLDNPSSISEHLYPAFGDWDNNPHDYFCSHHQYNTSFPTELLPPPPMTTTNPFMADVTQVSSQQQSTTLPTSSTLTSNTFSTLMNNQPINTNLTCTSACTSSHDVHFETSAKHSTPSSSGGVSDPVPSSKPQGPPCTRPVTLGGNTTAQSPCVDKGHSQHCLKHNKQFEKSSTNSQGHGKAGIPAPALSAAQTVKTTNHEGTNVKHGGVVKCGGKEDVGGKTKNGAVHSCSHGNKVHKQVNSAHNSCSDPHCQNSLSLPTAVNNVNVGKSVLCTDPECEGNLDELLSDNVYDTCSDKSSSTSSNPKEGKYCDCCYCEFFGHGNPASNKREHLREKMRKRLKNRNESRSEDCPENCQHECHSKQRDEKGLEELVKFINGNDIKPKRQRQKQRKAEEKKLEEIDERKRRKSERKLRKKLAMTAVESGKAEVLERRESFSSESSVGKKRGNISAYNRVVIF